ncbi:MAG TPA: flagellar hook assembly protein FlgD [Oligoflexus sp.]|uniref:flagellar hook assembly protein FlgD n=1 Tax=Oligoflexus sp. TaxID=1971216 RepID=UPI002D7FB353|nr:flagellar hook assembly protein FlgD [Oligoflexus sp.]HET9241355.1 flagellar hook assembly protein FlgD [Oligoflexus sp.]
MSTASVQNMIAPPVARNNMQDFSQAQVEDPRAPVESPKDKTDFRTLITNSMDEVIKERKAKENGDLSSAKTDAEFLEKLSDQTKEKRVPKNELGKDDFLKLFVTQLQNQNPLNPEADTEMAAKLAQFNGLEQMLNVNKSLEKMLAEQNTTRNLQLVNYVGRDVIVDGGRTRITEGKPTPTEYKVENDAAQSVLEVRNSSGILVHQIDLGPVNAGTHQLKWDGKTTDGKAIPDGTYTLNMTARNLDGKPVPVNLTSRVKVTGIDINSKDGGLFSEFGKIKFDQIKSVGLNGYDANMADAPIAAAPAPAEAEAPAAAAPGSPAAMMKAMSGLANPAGEPEGQVNAKSQNAQALNNRSAAEDLDRMMAEGKLKLPGKSDEASSKGASADSAKKSIDQQRTASAKLDRETPEKAPKSKPAPAKDLPESAAAVP